MSQVCCVLCAIVHVWFIARWQQNRTVLRSISLMVRQLLVKTWKGCRYRAVGSSYTWRWRSMNHAHSSTVTHTHIHTQSHAHTHAHSSQGFGRMVDFFFFFCGKRCQSFGGWKGENPFNKSRLIHKYVVKTTETFHRSEKASIMEATVSVLLQYLCLEPLDFCVLILQLGAELVGSHLLSLHNLHKVDVLLHQYLSFNDDVWVAGNKEERTNMAMSRGTMWLRDAASSSPSVSLKEKRIKTHIFTVQWVGITSISIIIHCLKVGSCKLSNFSLSPQHVNFVICLRGDSSGATSDNTSMGAPRLQRNIPRIIHKY